jgi:alanine racemase
VMKTSHVTTLTLDLGRVRSNLKVVREHLREKGGVEPGIIAVIKGFGYGTDDTVLAKLYAQEGVEYLAVAYVEEGVQLREAGVKGRVLVLNPDYLTFNMLGEYGLEPSLISMYHLNRYLVWARETRHKLEPIHLNFDSGMHRLGISPDEVVLVGTKIKEVNGLRLGTVHTHLAATESDEHDAETLRQLEVFSSVCEKLRVELKGHVELEGFKMHALNSSGVVRFPGYGLDYVRVGLGLLGSELSRTNLGLKPAVHFKTVITQIRVVPAGKGLGYGYAEPSDKDREIAWLPVGYADGYPRSLSEGKGRVAIGGGFAAVVGRVCMDLTAVDVTGLNVEVGDDVELFGDRVLLEDLSEDAGTIPYELIARIHQRVIRVVVD